MSDDLKVLVIAAGAVALFALLVWAAFAVRLWRRLENDVDRIEERHRRIRDHFGP